jgi:hypothetical protein
LRASIGKPGCEIDARKSQTACKLWSIFSLSAVESFSMTAETAVNGMGFALIRDF